MLPAVPPYRFAPAQTWMMPPSNLQTDHALQHFNSEPDQYRPATAPPIHNPNTFSTASAAADHSLHTTST